MDTIGPVIPPFRGELKIDTNENSQAKDYLPPNFGRLSVANLGTPHALDGAPPGVDTKLITGSYTAKVTQDSVVEIGRDCLSLVDRNHKHEVMEDQTEVVHGKTDLTYLHGRDVTVGDEDLLTVNGHQEIWVLGESEFTFRGKHEVHVPFEFEVKTTEQGFTAGELKFVVASATVRGREATYKVQDLECAVIKTEAHELAEELRGHKGVIAGLRNWIAPAVDVKPAVNAGPSVGTGTPVR